MLVLFGVALAVVPGSRPLAQNLVAATLVVIYETVLLCGTGATIGKLATGIEVRMLGASGGLPARAAFRRSVPIALCVAIAPPGTLLAIVMAGTLVVSVVLSAHRRGYHDRLAHTVVVRHGAPEVIDEADLVQWFDFAHLAVATPWGRAAELTERRRARAARLDDAPALVSVLVISAVAATAVLRSPWALLWTGLAWYVAFVADETVRVARTGMTAGHRALGLRIVDRTTGGHPSMGRSFARALVLGLFLYLPPLQLVLAAWVRGSHLCRGPHDLAGDTVVVEPGYVPPVPQAPLAPAPNPAFFGAPAWGPQGGWPPLQPGWAPPTGTWAPPPPYPTWTPPPPLPAPPPPPPPPAPGAPGRF